MERSDYPITPHRTLAVLAAGLALAAVHQYLFYTHGYGISVPLFVCLFYVYARLCAPERLRRPITWFGWLLFALIVLLSLSFVLFANPLFSALNLLLLPCLIVAHVTYLFAPHKRDWGDLRLVQDALDHLIPQALRHLATAAKLPGVLGYFKLKNQRKQAIGKVLLGLLLSLPLLIIVISLLTSADSSFSELLLAVQNSLSGSVSFGEGLFRLLYIVVLGLLLFGYIWGFVSPRPARSALNIPVYLADSGGDHPAPVPVELTEYKSQFKLDPLIAATVLILVNIVYVLFVSLQFRYLFSAWQGVLPEGSSYAEYARSGFFELIAVTVINFALLAAVLTFTGESGKRLELLNRILLYVVVGCSTVMLISAFTRLLLYEQAYGYTDIRFLSHAFMLYLAVLLLCAAVRIRVASLPLAKCMILVSLSAYLVVNYVNMDRIILEQNVERYRENGNIDREYLASLSLDVVPSLLKFSREEGDASLNAGLHERWDRLSGQEVSWQSYNVAKAKALRALQQDKIRQGQD